MDTSPGIPHSDGGAHALVMISGAADPTGGDAGGGAIMGEGSDAGGQDMPTRSAPGRQLVRRIRRLDDPEILRRVLDGLLNLQ